MKIKAYIISLLAALLCALAPVSEACALEYEGIDVSVWQGAIDFDEVKAAGKEIVYIRAGYGLTEDSRYKTNAYNAKLAGLNIGYYFFVTAQSSEEAEAQAEYFASLISGEPYSCRPAVDFETFTGLTNAEINAIALAFSETLKSAVGQTPLFYTDVSAAEDIWEESLTAYPLWIANYGVSEPVSTGSWGDWAGFQYSDTGQVPGITGNVDLDLFTDAVFIDGGEAALPFEDVSENDWFYSSVLALYDDGLINGTTSTTFSPYADASRAVPLVFLYRLDGSPAVSGSSGFSDVPSGLWYSSSVAWAARSGIAQGVGDSVFSPLSGVTRQEASVFLYRYAVYKGYDTEKSSSLGVYADGGAVADWAEKAMEWAVGTKIIVGTSSLYISRKA